MKVTIFVSQAGKTTKMQQIIDKMGKENIEILEVNKDYKFKGISCEELWKRADKNFRYIYKSDRKE